ncbi:hypothetical protein B0H13DRAFT_2294801 [Mycena leptocephala]|nr:hypothetical protein B0H13DRAFT_2294801 [Mycena leptocephala]
MGRSGAGQPPRFLGTRLGNDSIKSLFPIERLLNLHHPAGTPVFKPHLPQLLVQPQRHTAFRGRGDRGFVSVRTHTSAQADTNMGFRHVDKIFPLQAHRSTFSPPCLHYKPKLVQSGPLETPWTSRHSRVPSPAAMRRGRGWYCGQQPALCVLPCLLARRQAGRDDGSYRIGGDDFSDPNVLALRRPIGSTYIVSRDTKLCSRHLDRVCRDVSAHVRPRTHGLSPRPGNAVTLVTATVASRFSFWLATLSAFPFAIFSLGFTLFLLGLALFWPRFTAETGAWFGGVFVSFSALLQVWLHTFELASHESSHEFDGASRGLQKTVSEIQDRSLVLMMHSSPWPLHFRTRFELFLDIRRTVREIEQALKKFRQRRAVANLLRIRPDSARGRKRESGREEQAEGEVTTSHKLWGLLFNE